MGSIDYYTLLNISPDEFDESVLRTNYRALVKKHHPDQVGGDETLFIQIQTAYQTLKSPELRAEYDKGRLQTSDGPLVWGAKGEAPSESSWYVKNYVMSHPIRYPKVVIIPKAMIVVNTLAYFLGILVVFILHPLYMYNSPTTYLVLFTLFIVALLLGWRYWWTQVYTPSKTYSYLIYSVIWWVYWITSLYIVTPITALIVFIVLLVLLHSIKGKFVWIPYYRNKLRLFARRVRSYCI